MTDLLTGFYYVFQWKEAKPEDIMDTKLRCVFERLLPSATEEVSTMCIVQAGIIISIIIDHSLTMDLGEQGANLNL